MKIKIEREGYEMRMEVKLKVLVDVAVNDGWMEI